VRVIVTGAGGFIGSHVTERLLRAGHDVVGVDALTPYYDPDIKRDNLRQFRDDPRFTHRQHDLRTDDLAPLIADADVVYHLAAQPGVRGSWSQGFEVYAQHNVLATQRLLEAARATGLGRLVYASSSSVYGNSSSYPCLETDPTAPYSPYGVTKLAAEHLCRAYAENFGLSTVSLRYFTVFGPRQRPEMATSRLIDSALTGEPFPLFGDGSAVRDFTYVGDIADATIDAGLADVPAGAVANVGGGAPVSVAELIDLVGQEAGRPVPVERRGASPGDVRRTGSTTEVARDLLDWEPKVSLAEGVRRQIATRAEQLVAA
jgi:UDP-glucuronate 4-epimerase